MPRDHLPLHSAARRAREPVVAPEADAPSEGTCPSAEGIDCKAKLKLSKGKKAVGSAKAKVKSGKTKTVKVKVKGLGGGRTTLDASASFTDASGDQVTTKQRVAVG